MSRRPAARAAPRSILIVRLGAIGDVVHGLPLACRLRRAFPGARIAWAVGPAAAPLLAGHPAIDEAIVLEKRAPLDFLRRALARRARGRFDVAIDLQALFPSALAALLLGARRRLSFDRARTRELSSLLHTERVAPADPEGPIVAQNLALAEALGAPPAPLEFGLRAPPEARRAAARALGELAEGRFAALIVGAGKRANRPPPALLADVARGLARFGLASVVVGGAADRGEARGIAEVAGAASLAGKTDLLGTLAVLERAAVVVGGDTGPLHLAAAAGTPVVGIYGAASPRRTGPVGAPAIVVGGGWPCAPCYRDRCPIDRGCMTSIRAADVVAAAAALARSRGVSAETAVESW